MNKLTPSQIQSNLEAYKHAMETEENSKDIEYQEIPGAWRNKSDNGVFYCDSIYRIRPKPPEPKWRAWNIEEIQLGSIVRHKTNGDRLTINGISCNKVLIGITYWSIKDVYSEFELYNGKTWQPAGVLE